MLMEVPASLSANPDAAEQAQLYAQMGLSAISADGAQFTQSKEVACPAGGSLTYSMTDRGTQGTLDAGDVMVALMTNCRTAQQARPINGSFALAFVAVTTEGQRPVKGQLDVSYSHIAGKGPSRSGNAVIAFDGGTVKVTSQGAADRP